MREDLVPPQFPARPSVLVLDDQELLDSYAANERGEKISGDKRRQLVYLATWRCGVWDSEALAGRRLCSLLDSWREFVLQEHHEEAETLRQVLQEEWGVDPRTAPEGCAWSQLRDWSLERAKRFDLLPLHLRVMRAPRGGLPIARGREERAERENQGGFRW